MSEYERELGQIQEGIRNLNIRYISQEKKMEKLESNIFEIRGMMIGEPTEILRMMEDKFVTKESIKPLIETHSIIKKAGICITAVFIACIAVLVEYIRRHV